MDAAVYHAHGLNIASDFALPELRGCERARGHLGGIDLSLCRIARRHVPEPEPQQWSVRHAGSLSVAHGPWGTVFESYCGSRAWLPADLRAGGAVLHVARAPGIAADLFHHTLLHAFVPHALVLLGHTLVHAACVVAGDRAFLFAGASRMGKSTLAAGLAARGLAVFSDDVVRVLGDAAGAVRVWPSYPGVRLRGESFLLDAAQRAQPPGLYGLPRFRVRVGPAIGAPADGVEVGGVCFLGRGRTVAPRWQRLSPTQALTPWVESCFLLSLPKPQRLRVAFERGSELVRSAPAWRVSYRRSAPHFQTLWARLADAMQAIAHGQPPGEDA